MMFLLKALHFFKIKWHIVISVSCLLNAKTFISNPVRMEKNLIFIALHDLNGACKFCASAPKIFSKEPPVLLVEKVCVEPWYHTVYWLHFGIEEL